jgi:hypothetical protein
MEAQTLIGKIGTFLQQCKDVATVIKASQLDEATIMPKLEPTFLSREMADQMVALYFTSFESVYRVLHRPSFQTEYHKYWTGRDGVSIGSRLQVLLVIGIGSSLSESGDSGTVLRKAVRQWIYAAQKWLSGPLKKDRLDPVGLQVYCLTILARQIFSVGGDLVWVSMGSLMHRAMQIGLHRDPKHLPPMSILQAEIRRRLWYTILEMVTQSSLDSAMPPRVSFDEFDTEAPSNSNDDDMNELTKELHAHPKSTYTTTSLHLLLLDSLPTRLRIVRLLSGLKSELSYLDVLSLSSELTKAYQSCSTFLDQSSNSAVTPFQRNLLHYLVRRFMIPLHCPFASKARTNPLFHYSLKASLDAALAIVSPEVDVGYYRVLHIGGGMFREGLRLAGCTISMELLAQVENQGLDRSSEYRKLLKKAIKDMISLHLERIRLGETNVKSHMFLCQILAQAEAVELGNSLEQIQVVVAKSGRDSLELCYDLLQERALSASSNTFDLDDQHARIDEFGDVQDEYINGADLGFEGLDFLMPGSI